MSILSIGCLVGALMSGWLSDIFGRKPAIILGSILVAVSGMLHTAAIYLW